MTNNRFVLVNGITWFRVLAFPVLLVLIYFQRMDVFKWVLGCCFFTDAIDGILARKWRVSSVFGTRLDSIGDDLTIVAGVMGVWYFKHGFFIEQMPLIGGMLVLFFFQLVISLIKYGRITSFHTVLAKMAAIFQGSFLILLFFTPSPLYGLFYLAAFITTLELLEEIVLVFMLNVWRTNIKGLYWVLRERKTG